MNLLKRMDLLGKRIVSIGFNDELTLEDGTKLRFELVDDVCPHCKGSGVVDIGNNALPCICPAGDTALFNGPEGEMTGADVRAWSHRALVDREAAVARLKEKQK